VSFNFEAGACRTDGCVDENPAVDNVTIRSVVFPEKVVQQAALACVLAGGNPGSSGSCFYHIPIANVTTYNIATDFGIYIRTSALHAPPTFYQNPTITEASTYPNFMTVDGIASIIDCTGQASEQTIRYAWLRNQPGPCYYDWTYRVVICSNPGIPSDNISYINASAQILPNDAIWSTTNCPATA
jgi:hypothetical protein